MCVYHQQRGDGLLIIILYIDNITMMGPSLRDIKQLKSNLTKCYEITDLGEISSYLGIHITHDHSTKCLDIDQSGYIKDILDCFGMTDTNPHNTPLPTGADVYLIKNTGEASQSEIKLYQSLIGSLLYIQLGTCPDISFAVSHLVQYAANPSNHHLCLAKYVLSYLAGSINMHLCYNGINGDGLHSYSDSSLADQTDDWHSTCSYVFLLANGTISWATCKQQTPAQNTTEAEYMC